MAEKSGSKGSDAGVGRLREEQHKVVTDFEGQIQHWKKVSGDYEALDDRLHTLPDQLSYDIMVPFGPLAFMPGKLVHTNEVTVLLGDNWFAKCSAKQAQKIVDHRRKYVKCELDGLLKLRKNFEAKIDFTKGLENLSASKGNYVDIREEVTSNDAFVIKGKHRVAHKPHSEPKLDAVLHLEEEEEQQQEEEDGGSRKGILSEEELWARLDELEKLEEQQDEQDRLSDATDTNGDDTSSSSSSSEEEKEQDTTRPQNGVRPEPSWSPTPSGCRVNNRAIPEKEEGDDDDEEEDGNCLPTIYFSHTVEPKKVRINTGKNTMLKYSERKEQNSKRKKKNGGGSSNGHAHHELHRITTPTDIYRLFVDVRNGEPIPRKSILKSRSRENSVCSDTSESSAADMEERRLACRSHSHDEATHSDTSDGVTEESDCPAVPLPHPASRYQAFSGTVVEKDPMPSAVPHLTIAPPALPTIPEWKQEEVASDVAPPQEPPKRVSKFKAARLQQK